MVNGRLNSFIDVLENFFSKISSLVKKPKKLGKRVLIVYLIKELLLYFAILFVFFFLVFFVNQILLVAENLLKNKVPVYDVMRLLICYFPSIIAQSAPYATFVGFMMCLGRMMSDNEVLVFRASGISYSFIIIPVVSLGLIISIFSFFINDYLLPLGSIQAQEISREIFSKTPSVELESNSIKTMKGAKIAIGQVNDHNVSDVVFFQTDSDGKDRIIIAKETEVQTTGINGIFMQLEMKNPFVVSFDSHYSGNYDILDSESAMFTIFDTTTSSGSYTSTNPDQMTSYDLGKEIRQMKKEGKTELKVLNAYSMIFNRKFSIPFAAVFFSILSVSLAFLFGKHNGQTIGLVLGLIICVLNWAMMILGQLFSTRNGFNGFWAMWIPNLLLGGIGGLLYMVVIKK